MIILPRPQSPTIDLDTVHLTLTPISIVEPFIVLSPVHLTIGFKKTKIWDAVYLDTVHITVTAIPIPPPGNIVCSLGIVSLSLSFGTINYLSMSTCELTNVIETLYNGGKCRVTPVSIVSCDLKSILDNIRASASLPTIPYDPTDSISNLIDTIAKGNEAPYVYEDNSCYYVREGEFPFPSAPPDVYDILVAEKTSSKKWRSYDTGLTWAYDGDDLNFGGQQLLHGGATKAWIGANLKWKWQYIRKFVAAGGYFGGSNQKAGVSKDMGYNATTYTVASELNFPIEFIRKLDHNNYFMMSTRMKIRKTSDCFATDAYIDDDPYPSNPYNFNIGVGLSSRLFVDAGANGQRIFYADAPYDDFKTSHEYGSPPAGGYPHYKLIARLGNLMIAAQRWSLDGTTVLYRMLHSEDNGDFGSWEAQDDSDKIRIYAGQVNLKADICDAGNNVAFIVKTCLNPTIDSPHQLLKTVDGGYTWKTVNLDFGYHYLYVNGMCHIGEGILLMACYSTETLGGAKTSYIYRSADRGTTWEKVLTLQDYFPSDNEWLLVPDYDGSH